MNKKIIKNLIMVIASALLLLAATLAWFSKLNTASVGEISASINKIDVDYQEYNGKDWVDIGANNVATGMLIPGKEYRYRAIITAPETKDVLGYSVSLDGLKVTPSVGDIKITTDKNGEEVTVITDKYDVREHVFVRSYVVDGAGDPPTDVENYEFASYIGKGVENLNLVSVGYFGTVILDKEELTLAIGETSGLNFTVKDAVIRDIVWESSDETIVKVDNNGNVSAIAKGEATITAKVTTSNGVTISSECVVTVSEFNNPDSGTNSDSVTETVTPSVVIKAGEQVTVYYSIMIQGQDIGQDHNLISGATLEIGKVNVIMMYDDATTNETAEPSSVTTTKSEEEA